MSEPLSDKNAPGLSEPSAADRLAYLQSQIDERDDLLAMLTHELRNPLHALKLQLELAKLFAESGNLSDTLKGINKTRVSLSRYTNRATMLLDLIGRKRGYSAQLVGVVLTEVVTNVVEGLQLEASYHGVTLRNEVPQERIQGRTDPLVIEQILENLILNAFKHSGGNLVAVRWHVLEDERFAIEIADNGKGISEQDQQRVFNKHEVGRGNGQMHGTGLGLWIVRRLVDVLGGTLSLRSEVGNGCSFTVAFPLQAPS